MDLFDRIAMLKSEIEQLSDILDRDGLMSVGSQGQPVAHPAVGQRHAAIALLHKLEARVTDDTDDDALDEFIKRK